VQNFDRKFLRDDTCPTPWAFKWE